MNSSFQMTDDHGEKSLGSNQEHPKPMFGGDVNGISSIETLLLNIQGLLKVAAENARHHEHQLGLEKSEYLLKSFSFQPVLHDWSNKGCGMCHPVCRMEHIKEPLLLIGKSSPCGGSGFPLLFISHSSQCSTTGVTKAVVCVILSVGWCI